MRKNDIAATDVLLALVLLTRLPLPALPKAAFARQARAVWAFPLVGLLVGGLATLLANVALNFWPPMIAAGLLLLIQVLLTGAMHEDGLADCADGFWGGFDRERRLAIMKDSQIGTYGVLALVLTIGLRWLAMTQLLSLGALWAPIALAMLSRAAMPVMMASLPNARGSGLSQQVGRPTAFATCLGLAIALALSLWLAGPIILRAAILAALVVSGLRLLAKSKIGGQTGDVLGATQQITEITLALALLALI
ncbi:adenosylcobinamide-GDP ribazoletransferase [Phaeobacter sp. HF9A]|uniref:adenosylcobinamide-GDP ribazoletransferase n=1 Tax=Phaeobacter sp. HF9A TaxID=2721561 RepID=UPI0014310658|nr:adenosylcobinamide-GDP ribazoletransferase [Phaeobacter sp. HF9A]NIZ15190.1 adenosylcobinamide-GDP ribazoletransferase [Phaeobacter sp. HF9A]